MSSLEDLFQDVPASHRFPKLNLPPALTEMEALAELRDIAAANETVQDLVCFLGAGAYNHYIPPVVDAILRRGEFYTAYTPYQPEVSQGTLQAIFDYQSLIAALTGMEVSNASHYDGATAVAEAVSLAYANFRGKRSQDRSLASACTLNTARPCGPTTTVCRSRSSATRASSTCKAGPKRWSR